MADLIIPLPDANGYWHFIYVTTDPETGEWYGGKRSNKKHPANDRYLGSGIWIRTHPFRERLRRKIVAFYASSAEVFAAEAEMITWTVIMDDALCMNKTAGGVGLTVEDRHRMRTDPNYQKAHTAAMQRLYASSAWREAHAVGIRRRGTDPKWVKSHTEALQRRKADPNWQKANAAALQRTHANPDVQAKIAASNRRLASDPEWLAANAVAIQRMRADPNYQEVHAAAMQRMHDAPEWKEAHTAGIAKRSENPEWRERNAAHLQRMRARRAAKALLAQERQHQLFPPPWVALPRVEAKLPSVDVADGVAVGLVNTSSELAC